MPRARTQGRHQKLVLAEAEKLVMSGMSILALYLPGERMSGGREASGKEPREAGWSKKPAGEERATEVLSQLRSRDSNLGVRLGTPSRGLVDVDMDCPEAEELGKVWLPETNMVFGRVSCPESHRVYSWDASWAGPGMPELKTRKFTDVSGGVLIEIRSTGGQTAFPGTRHKSGEIVDWVDGRAGKLDGPPGSTEDLERGVMKVAAGAILARNWETGSFHDGSLALAGGLVRAGWERADVEDFVLRVGGLAGMANLEDRRRAVGDTWDKFKEGENVCGWPTAAEIFGDDVISRVRGWLMIGDDLAAETGELDRNKQVPWRLFPDPKTKLVDGESVITGLKGTIENVGAMFKAYGIEVAFDEVERRFKRQEGARSEWQLIDDAFDGEVASLAARNGLPSQTLKGAVNALAARRTINPVAEWLKRLEWDGKDHFRGVEQALELAPGEDEQWRTKFVRKWLIQAVAAADGARQTPREDAMAKFESVLVLLGEQGANKTKWITQLVPEHLRAYMKTSLHIDPADRDSVRQATTCWVGEIGELDATFKRADISRLKAFLSQTYDEYRVPYGARIERYPRLTAFTASVNERNFLQDMTGNRRFWVLHLKRAKEIKKVEQVWAQAWAMYRKGESWWMSPEEDARLHEYQKSHMAIELDPVYQAMHACFPDLGPKVRKPRWMSIQEIAEEAGLVYGLDRVDLKTARKIASYMREYSKSHRREPIEKRPNNQVRFAVPVKTG